MQGRLSPPRENKIQSFPKETWRREIVRTVEQCPYCGFELSKSLILTPEIVAILPHDYAIQVLEMNDPGGLTSEMTFVKLFRKGDSIPCTRKEIVRTSIENQRLYKLALFNIVDDRTEEVAKLWGSLPEGLSLGTECYVSEPTGQIGVKS
jgi:hypothetical protein